jgi:hypothetical protein
MHNRAVGNQTSHALFPNGKLVAAEEKKIVKVGQNSMFLQCPNNSWIRIRITLCRGENMLFTEKTSENAHGNKLKTELQRFPLITFSASVAASCGRYQRPFSASLHSYSLLLYSLSLRLRVFAKGRMAERERERERKKERERKRKREREGRCDKLPPPPGCYYFYTSKQKWAEALEH